MLHHPAELDLQPTRKLQPVLVLQQVRHPALARLAVDADHRLIRAAQVLRIDGQIGHLPDVAFLAGGKCLLDGVLVRAREGRVDQVTHIRMTRVHRDLVAVLHHPADLVDVGEVQPRRNPLRVQVQRDVGQVAVAGALTVAEEAAFQPVGPGHQRQLGRRNARAPVVVRVHRQDDRVPLGQVAMHPLDHVGKDVRRAVLHRRGQVDDALVLRRGPPGLHHGIHHPLGERQLGIREHLGRILEAPLGLGMLGHQLLDQLRLAHRHLDDAILIHPQHHLAHDRCTGVVDVHRGLSGPLQRLDRATDQRLTGLRQHLDAHVVRDQVLLDQPAHEVELGLRGRREAHLDLLEADVHQQLEHLQLALDAHRLDQRLVTVAQIGAQPDRCLGQHGVRPGAILQADGRERAVFGSGLLQHEKRS